MTPAFAWTMSMFFVVMDYTTGQVLYRGNRLSKCAAALEPGTVYGAGDSFVAAEQQARQRMESVRQSQKELENGTSRFSSGVTIAADIGSGFASGI